MLLLFSSDKHGALIPGIVNNYGGNEPTQLRHYYGGIDPMVHSMRNVIKLFNVPPPAAAVELQTQPPAPIIESDSQTKSLARGRIIV